MISSDVFQKKKEMKGSDCPTRDAKLFTRDFRRNVIRGIGFCILSDIMDTISNIYSFDALSRIQIKT